MPICSDGVFFTFPPLIMDCGCDGDVTVFDASLPLCAAACNVGDEGGFAPNIQNNEEGEWGMLGVPPRRVNGGRKGCLPGGWMGEAKGISQEGEWERQRVSPRRVNRGGKGYLPGGWMRHAELMYRVVWNIFTKCSQGRQKNVVFLISYFFRSWGWHHFRGLYGVLKISIIWGLERSLDFVN